MAAVNCAHFYENVHCGPSAGTPDSDPTPGLQALLDVARRSARVRILLDGFLGTAAANAETVANLTRLALAEQLNLRARLSNPTSPGLHSKTVLAHIGARAYVRPGGTNGNETSSKVSRELALQVQSDAAHGCLLQPFASAPSSPGRHRRRQRRFPPLAVSQSRGIAVTSCVHRP